LESQPFEGFGSLLLSVEKLSGDYADACLPFVKFDSIYRQIHRLFINSERFRSSQRSDLNHKDNVGVGHENVTARSTYIDNVNFVLLVKKIQELINSLKKDRHVPWDAFLSAFSKNLGGSSRSGLIGNLSKTIKALGVKIDDEKAKKTPDLNQLQEMGDLLVKKTNELASLKAGPTTGKTMASREELYTFTYSVLGDSNAKTAYEKIIDNNKDNAKFRNLNEETNYKLTDGNGLVIHEAALKFILGTDEKLKNTKESERTEMYQDLIGTFVKTPFFRTYVLEFLYYSMAIYSYARITSEATRDRKRSESQLEVQVSALKTVTPQGNVDEISKYNALIKVYKEDIKKHKKHLKSLTEETKTSRHATLVDAILKEANEGRPLDFVLDKSDESKTGVGKKRKEIEQRIGYKITDQHIAIVQNLCETGVLKISDGYSVMGKIVGMHPEAVQYIVQYHN
jgi:flagellar biosynthesis chaperone FliJ